MLLSTCLLHLTPGIGKLLFVHQEWPVGDETRSHNYVSLATYMEDGTLLTHGHGAPPLNSATWVAILNSEGAQIAVVDSSNIVEIDRPVEGAYASYRLNTVNLDNEGIMKAAFGDSNSLSIGDSVVVPRWKAHSSNGPELDMGIEAIHSTAKGVYAEGEWGSTSHARAHVDVVTESGDSGGGLWWNGQVIGVLRGGAFEAYSVYELWP